MHGTRIKITYALSSVQPKIKVFVSSFMVSTQFQFLWCKPKHSYRVTCKLTAHQRKFGMHYFSHLPGWNLPQVCVQWRWKLQPGIIWCVPWHLWWWQILKSLCHRLHVTHTAVRYF